VGQAFFLPIEAVPDIRGGRFLPLPNAPHGPPQ
jgi:hypothetical protein